MRRRPPARCAAMAAGLWLAVAPAQARPAPAASLIVDPPKGAAPRLPQPSPPLPPARTATPAAGSKSQGPVAGLPPPRGSVVPAGGRPWGEAVPGGLPAPGADPLHIDPATDPILQLSRAQSSPAAFRQVVREAVARNPALDEAVAQVDEAAGVRGEARARTLPVADLSISTFRVIDRAFSNDPGNILERSRPRNRTDGLVSLQQPIVDFGSGISRIRASRARLEAARAGVEDTGTRIALQAVSAWYTVYGYRALLRLGEAFAVSQRALRTAIEDRVRQGAAAPADIAQVDSYIASSDSQLADFRRELAGAEAQYAAVIGHAAPPGLSRAPIPVPDGIATPAADMEALPVVRAARLDAAAAHSDARAARASRLPQLSAGIDAGRYGVIETRRDYEVRGNLTLSMRLGGGAGSRIDQADARAGGADARLRRTRIEARRDADIALADVAALGDAQAAIAGNYLASRRSRDVLAERFRVSRGTLFDLLGAESNYFGVAVRYVQAVIELDTARYALLARTGRLLPALGIAPAALETR